MKNNEKIQLNIGAGRTYIPGFTNIDISPHADISLNLSKDKLPFDNSSVDLVFSHHTLEHIPDYLFALSEIFRVLKHNGIFLVGLPYLTLTKYNLVNPYHLHHFNEYSFDFFAPSKLKGSAMEENQINFEKVIHRFHYIGKFNSLPAFMKNWCRKHLFNVVSKIDFALIAVKKHEPEKDQLNSDELMKKFDTLLRSRKRYKLLNVKNGSKVV